MHIDELADIVNKYKNTFHSSIKMKPVDVNSSTYIDLNKENNKEDPKFKVSAHVRLLTYEKIFAKGYAPNWSEDVFVIKKVRNTVPWTYVMKDLHGEEIGGRFSKKELQKTNQAEFRVAKIIKRKGDKLYVTWKGYDNYFNSWIDKKCSYMK